MATLCLLDDVGPDFWLMPLMIGLLIFIKDSTMLGIDGHRD